MLLHVRCRRLAGDVPWQGGGELSPWPLQHITVVVALDRAGAGDGWPALRAVLAPQLPAVAGPALAESTRLPVWAAQTPRCAGTTTPWASPMSRCRPSRLPRSPATWWSTRPTSCTRRWGVSEPRRLIEISYVAEPRTDAQLYFLRERDACSGGEFRMPRAVAASTDPALRDTVARWTELGFDPA